MSLYIPGLNLPQANQELWIAIQSDGSLRYNSCGCHDSQQKAIAVQSHGRLIDADAPIEVWEVRLSDGDSCSFRNIKTTVSKFLLSHLMGEVPPTIIPAEEGET